LKRHAQKYVGDGVCLIGDSAHTTHPMQAQGMSMALNDILHLYRLIEKLGDDGGREVFTKEVLSEYESRARPFNTNVLESNHTLFGYFEKLSQNVESFPECLPFMEKVGFKPVTR